MSPQPLPDRIGRYEIVSEIGRGAMGRVFLARDPNVDRAVALKVLAAPHLLGGEAAEEEARRRFLLEARAAGRLSHPGIVMVLDADSDPATGAPYIAMELVEGRSLESLLADYRRLSAARAVAIVVAAARALAYAHAQGIVHRDVKPTNILVADSGAVKLADFGIAKLPADQALTMPGSVLGSPYYMSPEQARGEPLDRRSDLFSLGSVLYRALTGVVPFGGDDIPAVLYKVAHVDPRPVRSRVLGLPPSLERLVERALAKERALRFQDGEEMGAALDAVAAELRGEAPAPEATRPPAGGAPGSVGRGPAGASPRAPSAGVPRGTGTVVLETVPPRPASDRPPASPGRPLAPASAGGGLSAAPPADALAPGGAYGGTSTGRPSTVGGSGGSGRSAEGRRAPRRVAWAATALSLLALGAVVVSSLNEGGTPAPGAPASGAGLGTREAATAREPARGTAPGERERRRPPGEAGVPAAAGPAAGERRGAGTKRSTLHLVYNDRLSFSTLTVSIDGQRTWSDRIGGTRGVVQRVVGRERRWALEVPAGEHSLRVRIVGSGPGVEVDATQLVRGRFEPGKRHYLRIALNPLSNHLRLTWMDWMG